MDQLPKRVDAYCPNAGVVAFHEVADRRQPLTYLLFLSRFGLLYSPVVAEHGGRYLPSLRALAERYKERFGVPTVLINMVRRSFT